VLLTFEDYQRLSGIGGKIADLLAMPGAEDIPLEISRSRDLPRVADLS
jgi:hypothetical protein